ncbi:MAG: proteasome-associated ATPase [Patescibacteria group bacterium]|nr:proteasome-associated ATPase [Patescibacteria group bacterium]
MSENNEQSNDEERAEWQRQEVILVREISDLNQKVADLTQRNERNLELLKDARNQLLAVRQEIERLGNPPSGYGVFLNRNDDETADVYTSGRKMRVQVSPGIDLDELQAGQSVRLNEALTVVGAGGFNRTGELCTMREVLYDVEGNEPPRAVVVSHSDEEQIVWVAASLDASLLKAGDTLLVNTKEAFVFERVPKPAAEQLVLEEVPDISYEDVGGLKRQIEQIRDAVELPYLHADLFAEYKLRPPKGVLLYGPPGCGKTMIAKAVANSLAKKVRERTGDKSGKAYFLNIKGPELLNKYVGETERHIREIFQRAREKASEGMPVIVFFDEMESLFRTRGSGVSSDMESTVVPQLLSEIDGVEGLENVLVIGASNREDMIDPAVLRPGRLDVKIKVERPDQEAAVDIFSKYLTVDLPLHADDLAANGNNRDACVKAMIEKAVDRMYSKVDDNRFLEVTYANGDKEVLYFKDFNSGAMTENIVSRAKKYAVKAAIEGGQRGIRIQHLMDAIVDEFTENEDLPNTTNPDDWARISGKKGERIVYIRTLIKGHKKQEDSGRAITAVDDNLGGLGQYL